jgi:hypothetical protein
MGKGRHFKWTEHSSGVVARAVEASATLEGRLTPSAILGHLQSADLRHLPTIHQLKRHLQALRKDGQLADLHLLAVAGGGGGREAVGTSSGRS